MNDNIASAAIHGFATAVLAPVTAAAVTAVAYGVMQSFDHESIRAGFDLAKDICLPAWKTSILPCALVGLYRGYKRPASLSKLAADQAHVKRMDDTIYSASIAVGFACAMLSGAKTYHKAEENLRDRQVKKHAAVLTLPEAPRRKIPANIFVLH